MRDLLISRKGDRHCRGATVAIKPTGKSFHGVFVKFGLTVATEAEVWEFLTRLKDETSIRDYQLRVPDFMFDSQSNLLAMEMIDGESYKYLETCRFSLEQLWLLFSNVELSESFSEELLRLVAIKPTHSFRLARKVCVALRKHPEWKRLEAALAKHFSIDLDGEGFRGITEIALSIANSDTAHAYGARLTPEAYANGIVEDYLGNSPALALEHLHRQLGFHRFFAEALSIYDAHPDNFLLPRVSDSQSPSIVLTDFECVLGGTSKSMMPTSLPLLISSARHSFDLPSSLSYQRLVDETYEELKNDTQTLRHIKNFRDRILSKRPRLEKRVIYTATADYLSAIKALKEGLFVAEAINISAQFNISNKSYPDLHGALPKVLHFQIWKRYFRGVGVWPPEIPESMKNDFDELQEFLADYPRRRCTNNMIASVTDRIERLTTNPITNPVELSLFRKIIRPLCRLPHQLFFPNSSKNAFEIALAESFSSEEFIPKQILEHHALEVRTAIAEFSVPHHALPINWPVLVSPSIIEDAEAAWGTVDSEELFIRVKLTGEFIDAVWSESSVNSSHPKM